MGKGDSLLVAHHATPPVYVAAGAKKDALKLEQKVRSLYHPPHAASLVRPPATLTLSVTIRFTSCSTTFPRTGRFSRKARFPSRPAPR